MEAPARTDATAPVGEEKLAALREEIRRAGQQAGWLRVRLWIWAGFAGACVFVSCYFLQSSAGSWIAASLARDGVTPSSAVALLQVFAVVWFPHAAAWGVVGVLTAEAFLWLRSNLISRRLASLPRHSRMEMLRSVHREGGEAGKLAERLLRDLNLPTELTPAGTPEGSGAEVSGVRELQQ